MNSLLTYTAILLFVAEGVRRIYIGLRMLVLRDGMSRADLGLEGDGRLISSKARWLGLFYVFVGVIMVALALTVWITRGFS